MNCAREAENGEDAANLVLRLHLRVAVASGSADYMSRVERGGGRGRRDGGEQPDVCQNIMNQIKMAARRAAAAGQLPTFNSDIFFLCVHSFRERMRCARKQIRTGAAQHVSFLFARFE